MIVFKKLLYMLGVLVALVAMLAAGVMMYFGAQRGAWSSVLVAAIVACAGAAFIWFAHRRTNALEAERGARKRSEAAALIDAALARPVAGSRFAARRNLLALAGATLLVVMFAGGAVLAWTGGAYVLAALVGSVAGILLWFLTPALSNREAIAVGVRGVEVPGRYDLIPWNAIQEAFLSSYEDRGVRVVELRLGVKDPTRYRSSRWFLSLNRSHGAQVVVPLRGLDQTPEAVFAALRQFHERAAPRGTLVGTGASYRIDPRAARLEVIHKRMLEVGEEMKRMADDLAKKGPVADDSPQLKAFERASESRLKEMEALSSESSTLISEQARELEDRMTVARRSLNRLRWLTYAFLAFVVLYGMIKVLAR